MDCLDVAKKINLKIIELESLKETLSVLAKNKSEAMVKYEKALAKEVLVLALNSPVSLIDKLAKGSCADLRGEMEISESIYKNQIKIIDITLSQLNGYQSINRYLAEL